MVKPKFLSVFTVKTDRFLSPIIMRLAAHGIRASHVTAAQIPFFIAMFWYLTQHAFVPALICFVLGYFLDVLDGSFARITNTVTRKGHLYDKTTDLFGIYAFILGMAIAESAWTPLLVVLGVINALLYLSNELVQPEYYCGIRPVAFVAIWLSAPVVLWIPILLGVVLLIIKGSKILTRRTEVDGRKTTIPRRKNV